MNVKPTIFDASQYTCKLALSTRAVPSVLTSSDKINCTFFFVFFRNLLLVSSLRSSITKETFLTHTHSGLWAFFAAWRILFDRFDEDKSGYISFDEYTNALVAFGYRLSFTFVDLLYRTYAKSGENRMSFDLFVQSCIILKRMTDVFKNYVDVRDGYITFSFEEFLTGEFFFSFFFFWVC